MQRHFRPSSTRTPLGVDPVISAAAAGKISARLALMGFPLSVEHIAGKPISAVVGQVCTGRGGGLVSQALRDELSHVR